MRTIKFKLLTQVQLEKVEAEVTTFGQLKDAVLKSEFGSKINFNGVKFIERNSKAEYGSIDEAILPAGDLLFFVTPTKTDSGLGDSFEVMPVEALEEMGYNELKSYGSKVNHELGEEIDLSGKRDDILERLVDWTENLEIPEESIDAIPTLLSDAIELISQAIEMYLAMPEGERPEYAIEGVTVEELQAEAERLKQLLNK